MGTVVLYETKPGPNPSLTPALARAIAEFVRMGASPVRAAAACGVKRKTWYGWVAKHDRGERPYDELIGFILIVRDADSAAIEMELRRDADAGVKVGILKQRDAEEIRQRPPTKGDLRKLTDEELHRIAYGGLVAPEDDE